MKKPVLFGLPIIVAAVLASGVAWAESGSSPQNYPPLEAPPPLPNETAINGASLDGGEIEISPEGTDCEGILHYDLEYVDVFADADLQDIPAMETRNEGLPYVRMPRTTVSFDAVNTKECRGASLHVDGEQITAPLDEEFEVDGMMRVGITIPCDCPTGRHITTMYTAHNQEPLYSPTVSYTETWTTLGGADSFVGSGVVNQNAGCQGIIEMELIGHYTEHQEGRIRFLAIQEKGNGCDGIHMRKNGVPIASTLNNVGSWIDITDSTATKEYMLVIPANDYSVTHLEVFRWH